MFKERSNQINECPGYDTKQFDSEIPVMLELLGMQSTPSLLLLQGSLWPGIELNAYLCLTGLFELEQFV